MATILVVDDEPSIRIVVRTSLEANNHTVLLAEDGRKALELANSERPDLIVLDWMLPGMSGLEVCHKLRANPASVNVPIIFLTAVDAIERKVAGLESGADDYMTKPFEPRELLARVSLHLRKASERGQINPLSLLPGNALIEKEISARLALPDHLFALLYFDLDDFKTYNDYFGFSWGDRLLKAMSESVQQALLLHGDEGKFLGHIGGDDFVAMTAPERVDTICQHAIREFDRRSAALCIEAGAPDGFDSTDRAGRTRHFGPPTLSIGVVTNQFRAFGSYLDLGQVAAQVKKAAKRMPGSAYLIDRRQDFAPESVEAHR